MSMTAFATVTDLQAGWKTLTTAEQDVATTLLLRATATLTAILARRGVEIDATDDVQAENLKTVTCNMVRRSMSSGGADGIAQVSQMVGSTSVTAQMSNPEGAFYLSRLDKELLGILGGGRIGWAAIV